MKKLLAILCIVFTLLSFASCDILLSLLDEGFPLQSHDGTVYDQTKWTILVYMNGSNLESDGGLATGDIDEMIHARYNSDDIRIVIQTGGTLYWNIEGIPGHNIARFLIEDGDLKTLEILDSRSIGDSGNLSSLIDFGRTYFPAERCGLILWNHGGGSVAGFGADEWYDGDGLTLKELGDAFAYSDAAIKPFDFVGFDACLMGSAETAWTLRNYARYLVASEEVEPGYGWDYLSFLGALGSHPEMETVTLCQHICDSYVDFYLNNQMGYEVTTLSAVDLSRMDAVVSALDAFAAKASLEEFGYRKIAKLRAAAHEYGLPRENRYNYDMVDILDLAEQYRSLAPTESEALISAVQSAVVYKAQNSKNTIAGGLSLYFPFSQPGETADRIDIYRNSGFSANYINYIIAFASQLTGASLAPFDATDIADMQPFQTQNEYLITLTPEQMDHIQSVYFTAWYHTGNDVYTQIYQDSHVEMTADGGILTEFDGIITTINGEWACLYEIETGENYIRYAVPALLNGIDVHLILLYEDGADGGRVLGAMPTELGQYGLAPKRLIPINDGDEIALVYYAETFYDIASEAGEADAFYYDGTPFIADGPLLVEDWEVLEGDYLYGFVIVDLQGYEYYTDYIQVSYH